MKQNIGDNTIEVGVDFSNAGPQSLAYNGDGTLNYVEVTIQNQVYRQTFGYTAGKLTTISAWVKS